MRADEAPVPFRARMQRLAIGLLAWLLHPARVHVFLRTLGGVSTLRHFILLELRDLLARALDGSLMPLASMI